MDDVRLTKDGDALICVLYKEYLERHELGMSKQNAKYFGGSPEIHENLMSKWSFEDVDDTCRELHRTGLMNCLFLNNIAAEAILADKGIVYMESRFKDNIKSVLKYLESLRSIIPW